MNYFGYDQSSFIPCEICGSRAVDIHHIDCKGMGGSKKKDVIENLMALCREDHEYYGDKVQWKSYLREVHSKKMETKEQQLAGGRKRDGMCRGWLRGVMARPLLRAKYER